MLLGAALASAARAESLIDRHIFSKLEADGIEPAPDASDSEFLRRVYLDLSGRQPTPDEVRAFLASTDPNKRAAVINALFPPLPRVGLRSDFKKPLLDRWTYYFADLFKNGQLLEEGINVFRDYIYKSLVLNTPYDEFVREMITASTVSTWTHGAANMVARWHVFEFDGYMVNHEDTCDEIVINTSKVFLGLNLECVSCHDGSGHLEKINLWLASRKRDELWRQAAFFGKTSILPTFGRSPQFSVRDTEKGYSLETKSALRPPRYKASLEPTFPMGGAQPEPGENWREAYARILTSHPQFARATVNLFWAELMGEGIVDPPFDFDLERQDPSNPPPAPWTIQPSHPELLDELADAFVENGYDLRWLLKTIVSSRAYQLSADYGADWKPDYERHFARRKLRRLSAEQLFDAVADITGVSREIQIRYDDQKVTRLFETHSPMDLDRGASENKDLLEAAAEFGQCDRYTREPSRAPSMTQAALLLNSPLVRNWVKVAKDSRLDKLLQAEPPRSNAEIVDEIYLAALSRPPSASEREVAAAHIAEFRAAGAEDLVWSLINSLEFLRY